MFSGTEVISITFDSEFAGERQWAGATLPPYRVFNVSSSISIMSARVSFEYKNILNEIYETVPDYLMPPRHYIIGIFWEFFD